MTPSPLQFTDLPGSERARRFDGRDHGAAASFFINTHAPGEGPNLHRHPYEETFIVLEGSPLFSVDGEQIAGAPGQIVIVPPNAVHGFKNSGDSRLKMVSIHSADHVIQEDLE
jgi:quercetin dioxygenase-like cupin family protein